MEKEKLFMPMTDSELKQKILTLIKEHCASNPQISEDSFLRFKILE